MQFTDAQRAELVARQDQLKKIRQELLDDANRKLGQLEGALAEIAIWLSSAAAAEPPEDAPSVERAS